MNKMEIEKHIAACKAEGLRIDPATAVVEWWYIQIVDPYNLRDELPPESYCVGRGYFARDPGGDIWVEFGDLPAETRNKLWEAHKHKLAFPAGLPLKWMDGEVA